MNVLDKAKVCTAQNLVRRNYFSDTYRAYLRVGDEERDWDVTHISLPFAPVKERELMARFGIEREALDDYYRAMGHCVQNYLSVSAALGHLHIPGVATMATYEIQRTPGGRGSDVYIVTEPLEPLTASLIFIEDNAETVRLGDILDLGANLVQIAEALSQIGAHLGMVDLDTTYIAEREGRTLVTLDGFLYASTNGYPAAMPAHVHPILREGEPPSFITDLYSICSLLWTLLTGNHYTTEADVSKTPQHIPDALTEALRLGLDQDNVYRDDPEIAAIEATVTEALRNAVQMVEGEADQKIHMADPVFDLSLAYRSPRQAE